MALTKITGQVINTTTDVTVGILTVTDTLAVGGTVSVGGTLTYEDVTNIDSIGIITARSGIHLEDYIFHKGDTNTSIGFPDVDTIFAKTSGAERVRIDSNGRIIIGHTASTGEARYFQLVGTSADTASAQLIRHSADSSSSQIDLTKSRNATKGSNTIVQDDDVLGQITFRGDDGTDLNSTGATIIAAVDGTPGSNDMPGRLVFSTTADGSSSATERLRISSTGAVGINSTNPENNLLELYTDASAAWKFRIHTSVSDGAGFYQRSNGDFELVLRDASNNNNHISGSAGGLQFSTSNTEKVRITSGGEVGIGTETPAHKLDVIDGIINVGAAVTTNDSRIQFTRKDSGIFSWVGIPNWNPNAFFIYVPKDSSPYNETGAVYESETWSIYSAGTHRLTINPSGHVLPAANDTYDLGSSSLRWRDIYTGDLNLSNKGKSNDVDGSWGDYTIQEGESDLFLINNRSGKKFKFNLTEVL